MSGQSTDQQGGLRVRDSHSSGGVMGSTYYCKNTPLHSIALNKLMIVPTYKLALDLMSANSSVWKDSVNTYISVD